MAHVERRQHPRYQTALEVELVLDGWSVPQRALTEDISRGGVSVILRYRPPLGHDVDVSVKLPGGHCYDVPARVCHARFEPQKRRCRVGLEFAAENAQQKCALDATLAELEHRLVRD